MLIDSAPPISSEYPKIFAAVPVATVDFLFINSVPESEPTICSFDWNTPVSVWVLFTTILLCWGSILRTDAVAPDTVPVIVSSIWKPLTESKYK